MVALKTCHRTVEKALSLIPEHNRSLTARKADIGVDKLNRWLNGTGGLSYDELWRLSVVLKCSTDWLLNDELDGDPDESAQEESRPPEGTAPKTTGTAGTFVRTRTKPPKQSPRNKPVDVNKGRG